MTLEQIQTRMRNAFNALIEHKPDILLDSSGSYPPTGRKCQSDYGPLHQAYCNSITWRRSPNDEATEEEVRKMQEKNPAHCIGSIDYIIGFSASYLSCLDTLAKTRRVYTTRGVIQELDGSKEACRHFLEEWASAESRGLDRGLASAVLRLLEYQNQYAEDLEKEVLRYIKARMQALGSDNYSYWDEVEALSTHFRNLKTDPEIITNSSNTDVYLASLAVVNSIKKGRRSKILSKDKDISDLVCIALREAQEGKIDVSGEHADYGILSKKASSVAVHYLDLMGNMITSVNTALLARGDKRMLDMVRKRDESRRRFRK